MKILILTKFDSRTTNNPGGVRTYNLNLIKIVESLGHDIEFYETKNIYRLLNFKKKSYQDFDLIIINLSIYDKGFVKLVYELIKIKNKKVIVQCHGGSFNKLKFKSIFKYLFSSLLRKKVDLFLVLNNSQGNSLNNIFDFPNKKIFKISNFIENDYNIKPKKHKKVRFFYIGRIVKEKGIFDFVEAFKEIENNNIEFNVVGSGKDEANFLKNIKDDNRINFFGKKFGQEKVELMERNDVFVFLTKLPEGFPIAVLEALNYGMPIISSKFPNSSQLVKNDYNGFEININKEIIKEKINFFVNNKEIIKEYGYNSKTLLDNNFSLMKQGIDIYDKIIKEIYK